MESFLVRHGGKGKVVRKLIMCLSSLLCGTIALADSPGNSSSSAVKPNFIVILADDMGYGDLGCFGNKEIKTPRLDRMANEGTQLTDFYVPAAQCTPARAAFLTGSYPQRINSHRLFGGDRLGINPDERTIAEFLGEQGYRTGCIGKWHLGDKPMFHPNNHGFDYFYGFMNPRYFDKSQRLIHRNRKVVATGPKTSQITDDLTSEAVEFIRRNKERPFFLYLAHDMPHVPLELPGERRGVSQGGLYGDVIMHIDESVGKVLDALRKNGIDKNTIVVFTSDNGPALHWCLETGSAGPLRGSKHTTCEGGFRVPAIVWAPERIPNGRKCSEIVSIMDMLPTFVGLAGGTVAKEPVIDGKNIWPVLAGAEGAKSPHDAFYYYKRHNKAGHIEGVRVGNWKLRVPLPTYHKKAKQRNGVFDLVELQLDSEDRLPPLNKRKSVAISNLNTVQLIAATEEVGLYNLAEDIGEANNLADKYPEKVSKLRKLMDEFDADLRRNSRPCGRAPEKDFHPDEG